MYWPRSTKVVLVKCFCVVGWQTDRPTARASPTHPLQNKFWRNISLCSGHLCWAVTTHAPYRALPWQSSTGGCVVRSWVGPLHHCTTGCVRAAFQMRMNVSLYYLCPYQLVPVARWHGAELHKCRINVVWCRARARLVMFPVTGTESSFHWSRVSGVENVVSCMNAARQIELSTKFRVFSTVFVESWLALSVNHWWVT